MRRSLFLILLVLAIPMMVEADLLTELETVLTELETGYLELDQGLTLLNGGLLILRQELTTSQEELQGLEQSFKDYEKEAETRITKLERDNSFLKVGIVVIAAGLVVSLIF